MLYGLTFTFLSLIFMFYLLVTIFNKKNTRKGRTKVYLVLVFTSLFFCISEIISIVLFSLTNGDGDLLQITWKIRTTSCFVFFEFFLMYHKILMKKTNYDTAKESIFNEKFNYYIIALFTLIALIYVLFVKINVFPDVNSVVYITGAFGIIMLIISYIIGLYCFITSLKYRREDKKIYISFGIMLVFISTLFTLQLIFKHIALLPFLTLCILYIIYFNIENPDIELLEEVMKLKDDIDNSNNTKLDFLFNLSYDLVNPINVIVSLNQSLENSVTFDREKVFNSLKNIKYAGNALLDSINNVLDNSEIEGTINLKEYNVLELLNRMKSIATTRIGEKQIKFEMEVSDNISSVLLGDIVKIQKILMNILSNAVKYTRVGKIKLIVSCTNNKDMQILHFKILDTGRGMTEEEKKFIFTDSVEKSGVGLALSKKYVELMDGNIGFNSVYGAGTTFYIDIPQKIVGNKLIIEDKKEEYDSNKLEVVDYSNYRVLIVDDDILDIKVARKMLEKYKFQITTITKTTECIDRIKREEYFDIIFIDHKMPEVDGVETMKILKDLDGYSIPKIVVLTANVVAGARETYLKEGFDEYISKPIDINELDRVIKKVLSNKK